MLLGGQKKWRTHGKKGLDFFCWLALAVMAVIIYSGVTTYLDNREVKAEIAKLKAEAARFEEENAALRNSQDHGQSEAFLEKEARVKLNLQKPGETVVFINRQGTAAGGSEAAGSPRCASQFAPMRFANGVEELPCGQGAWGNARMWWNMFFGSR